MFVSCGPRGPARCSVTRRLGPLPAATQDIGGGGVCAERRPRTRAHLGRPPSPRARCRRNSYTHTGASRPAHPTCPHWLAFPPMWLCPTPSHPASREQSLGSSPVSSSSHPPVVRALASARGDPRRLGPLPVCPSYPAR